MPKARHLTLRCPECQADLKIDAATGEVIFHKAAKRPTAAGKDFEKLLQELKEEKTQAEEIFEREVEALKNRDRLLEEKFQQALRHAEESPDDEPPPRPFDLD
ncbi:MAG: hypothetical protein OEM62_12390 [Acidobacteriota bacterium]|nr:hypothetical protein [Acidobacteriota bacterium]